MFKLFLGYCIKEPYRLFFPLGIGLLLWGGLVWLPQIWSPGDYPVLAHRYLMLNGFVGSFIAGFLMTAVPKFSKTFNARPWEVITFLLITLMGIHFAYQDEEILLLVVSSAQPCLILIFLFSRILKRQENPPYSFVFIFVGLFLWLLSGILGMLLDSEAFKQLQYEGAIAAIILGVGGRLLPGILGHVAIVSAQRERYEKPLSIMSTVPIHFFLLIIFFVASYFIESTFSLFVRAAVVSFVALFYWRLLQAPKIRTSLTWCLWTAGWMIMLSFILKASWSDGAIHASHAFFISGVVLLCLLVGIRVVQSHGPNEKRLENLRRIYLITFLIVLAAATRVSAYLMPNLYLSHLGYSAFILTLAVLIWAMTYLKYVLRIS